MRADLLRKSDAAAAFRDLSGKPAEANGRPVGVRYRYPVRFRLVN
jgi:hypothetical protein